MRQNELFSDEKLCKLAVGGDAEAEELLVKKYNKVVRACARPLFLMGGDSEDLIQEGMLGLIAAVRQFDPSRDTSFHTYAELCIKNRLYSAIKNAARLKHSPLNDYVSIESPHFDESKTLAANYAPDPEQLMISRESINELFQRIDGILSRLESQVLELYFSGQSYDEIARAINKSPKSVDNAVQRIRKKLARFN